MLDRLVVAIGPGADEIGTRVFGLLTRDYWETACSHDMTFRSCVDQRVLIIRTPDITHLPRACERFARNKQFHGRRILAYSSDLTRPYPSWYASARFPIHIMRIDTPLNRFQALEKTSALLSALGCHDPLIHERVRLSVDH